MTQIFTGVNEIGKIPGLDNHQLPAELQTEHPTGHSGRGTFSSLTMNAGVDAVIVSKATNRGWGLIILNIIKNNTEALLAVNMS
jgi:hypothetical protein